ncbi:YncE family protein [Halorubrum vacuolatum]|uniref:40-residue YVTN family beta-propeller repeat-containing protein n=1 Tax=Halorubrum vacuolatum TaxID=63740 RepID=A0A238Y2A0_HALVU|nr:hypothetical protein [Halorubrum vacuolatum]SNR65257.1 hypothetical protein SAMN06264855_12824 [Halorubrum vacuolatum]
MTRIADRRRFLYGSGVVLTAGLAGCLTDEGSDEQDHDDGISDDTEDGPEAVGSDGLVYAFAPDRICILDPADGELVDEITDEFDDESWADPQITSDFERIFIVEESLDQVHVINTETRTHETAIDVGPGVNHIYHPVDDEIWVHADTEGAFYVIDIDALEVSEIVESGLEEEGHGKLLYHEEMGDIGYATNVNDPGIPVIDLGAYERTEFIEFGEVGGTHYKAYSPENGLAYVEYISETVVVDPTTEDIVDEFDFTGGMFLSPEGDRLAIVDGEVYLVDVSDQESDVLGSLAIDGSPSTVRFGPTGETAFVANADSDEIAIIDVEELEEIGRLDAGEITGRNRMAVSGGDYFITPADADDSVAIVDMTTQTVDLVDVGTSVEAIQYVGDSGVGYSGKLR